MTAKPKTKKKESKKSKAPAFPKSPIIRSACEDEVILELYNKCLKIKRGRDVKKNIKIYLQNISFPVPIDYKRDALREMKKKKIIENYKLKIEEEESPPRKMSFESFADLLPLTSSKDLKDIPKYQTEEYSEQDWVATIKCNPQKVIKHFKSDFKRISRKKKKIDKRGEIEDFFKKEQVLKCGDLRFGLESGNAIYGEAATNFMPDKEEYKILKALMERPNKRLSHQETCKITFREWIPGDPNTTFKREISFIVRNIKSKLKIIGKKATNKNLFDCHNGYMITCG